MFEELKALLEKIVGPESTQNIITACELLSTAGYISHETALDNLLVSIDDVDNQELLDLIVAIVDEYLTTALKEFGMTVGEETKLRIKHQCLFGLITIEKYGDPYTLLNFLQQEVTPEEIISDILGEITSLGSAVFLPEIKTFDPEILNSIAVYLEKEVEEDEVTDVSLQRTRFSKFNRVYENSIAAQLVNNGQQLGSDFDQLIISNSDKLSELENNPKELAAELLGLFTISNKDNTNIMGLLGEVLEDYARNINVVSKARDYLVKYMKELF